MDIDCENLAERLRDLLEELDTIEEATHVRAVQTYEVIRFRHKYVCMLNQVAAHIKQLKEYYSECAGNNS